MRVRRRRRARRRWPRVVAGTLAVLLLTVTVVGLALAWRYLPVLDQVRQVKVAAQTMEADVASTTIDIDGPRIQLLRADLEALDSALAPVREVLQGDPLVDVARRLPVLGDQVAGADAIVAAADDLLAAGDAAMDVGDRYVAIREHSAGTAGESTLEDLVELMATSTDVVDQVAALLASAQTRLDAVPDGVIGQIREARDLMAGPIERYRPMLEGYARQDEIIPVILGWDGPKRYLVLAQNPAELRPTGGFIGTYGVVTFTNGRMTQREFHDVYQLDLQAWLPYVRPPDALKDHLLGEFSWQLADANWSPDFPTSAQDALRLYSLEAQDTDIDGVIGITTYALDRILDVTGPVHVPGYDTTVAAGETTFKALALTRQAQEPGEDRKQFLDEFAVAVLDRLFALPPAQWPQLLSTIDDLGRDRLASAWFTDPVAQGLVAGTTWSGEVRQDAGDYVFAVDANQAPASKYNLAVTRSIDLDIRIDDSGRAEDMLTLTYQNDAGRDGEPYASLREWSTNPDGTYATYTRVLTAPGSEIEEVSGGSLVPLSAPETVSEEAGRTVFANYLVVPPGDTSLSYRWVSPYAATIKNGEGVYTLTVQKQAGMPPEPLTLRIQVPAGARITAASPGLEVRDGVATLSAILTRDLQVGVRFRR